MGDLETARYGHGAIYDGSVFIIIGGTQGSYDDALPTEVCSMSNDNIVCRTQVPYLTEYTYYPELLLVADDFGKDFDSC